MLHADVHPQLDVIAARAVLYPEAMDDELREAERGADQGCTRCARALVNAVDAGADLALDGTASQDPGASLRERILRDARGKRAPAIPRSLAPPGRFPPDPSASVARHHIGGRSDAERTQEVDELAAFDPTEGEGTHRLLAEIERLIRFPILFVSIVRGDRVGYRVQRGLDPKLAEFRQIRREMSYCTHAVDTEAPFLVENAGAEPFFRASRMVRRYTIKAYAGVPLRTSRGIVIGTVCALDTEARAIPSHVVRTLELYTEPVLAIVERARRAPAVEPAGVHGSAWFRELLALELGRAPAPPSALIALEGEASSALPALAREGEIVGRLDTGGIGLLLVGTEPVLAETRAGELHEGLRRQGFAPNGLRPALPAGQLSAGGWIRSALQA